MGQANAAAADFFHVFDDYEEKMWGELGKVRIMFVVEQDWLKPE